MFDSVSQRRRELRESQLRSILPSLFGELSDETFAEILPHLNWKLLAGSETLFLQGDAGDGLYILVSGRLQVLLNEANGSRRVIGEIARGETVGEMSLFTGDRRTASIVAVRDSVLAKISPAAFVELIASYPQLAMRTTRLIIDRLQKRLKPDRHAYKIVNIALVPISPRVDIVGFARGLEQSLQEHGKTLLLSGETVGEVLHEPRITYHPPHADKGHRLMVWMDEQEALHDTMLYQADRDANEWTKRCLRQADEIYLIGHADDQPNLSGLERELLQADTLLTSAKRNLVLLHDSDSKGGFSGASRWLLERRIRTCHHARLDAQADTQRLARFICGRAVGLVLAGGGAKGLAHAGVFRALSERGVPVDVVGGTSFGSIVAAAIAMGWDADEVYRKGHEYFMNTPMPLTDYNFLPLISLFKGKRIEKLLEQVFADMQIADLNINFFCVSTNLSKTEAKVHARGHLGNAIRASVSLPGIFPPVIDGENLLIDGAIFNNLPIDVMSEMGVGRIVAVDFDLDQPRVIDFKRLPSNWEIIKNRVFNRLTTNVPSLMSMILHSTTINSDYRTRQMRLQADLFFNPDLSRFGMMDWKSLDAIIDAGYQHAIQVLDNWPGFDP